MAVPASANPGSHKGSEREGEGKWNMTSAIGKRELIIVAVSAVLGCIVIWALLRAMRTGEISSRGWTFRLDENPGGFLLVALCDLVILLGCIWMALRALGLVGMRER